MNQRKIRVNPEWRGRKGNEVTNGLMGLLCLLGEGDTSASQQHRQWTPPCSSPEWQCFFKRAHAGHAKRPHGQSHKPLVRQRQSLMDGHWVEVVLRPVPWPTRKQQDIGKSISKMVFQIKETDQSWRSNCSMFRKNFSSSQKFRRPRCARLECPLTSAK